jgi:hypothetical protein
MVADIMLLILTQVVVVEALVAMLVVLEDMVLLE